MRHSRRPVHGTAIAVAVVTSIALTAFVPAAGSTPEKTDARSLNRIEHEARRSLSDTREEQARTLKGGEHLARRPLAEAPQARSYNQREHLAHRDISEAVRVKGIAVSAEPYLPRGRHRQAWRDLGQPGRREEVALRTRHDHRRESVCPDLQRSEDPEAHVSD